jgi:DNA-binding SARP family transcriptional activator/basic membrane lipoprotein Med (substrate-binding protein (PBP1-ABC) superfamily)
VEYRLLGSFQVVRAGGVLPFGGVQQRAVLAMLLLDGDRVVSIERLVDGLWGERPPKSAAHTVRVYISQLRKLVGDGVLVTEGRGYLLRRAADDLDVDRFERLVDEGRALAEAGDLAAPRVLKQGLDLWRGPALAEFAEQPFAGAEIRRLDELRVECSEMFFDAQLGAGQGAQLVAPLEQLVNDHPLRERLAAQLMVALYRAGRQAAALDAYQRTREHLDEVGLQPTEQLKRLQAQILQHDQLLEASPPIDRPLPVTTRRPLRRRTLAVVLPLFACAVLIVSALAITSRDGHTPPAASRTPITLVLGGTQQAADAPPTDVEADIDSAELAGLRRASQADGVNVRVAYGDYIEALSRAARTSDLVILGPSFRFDEMARVTRRFPQTTFILAGGSVHDAAFGKNVVGLLFDDYEVGYLGGYLSSLEARNPPRVSAVAGLPTPEVERIVAGYRAGVRVARPGVRAIVGYSRSFANRAACEQLANRQIDRGSTVVFDIAGVCGFGALDAAGVRGVSAVGIDTDLSSLGPQVIGSVVKRFDSAIQYAIGLYLRHRLASGHDITLNLGNDAVSLVGVSPQVPASVRARIEHVISVLRAHDIAAQ